MTPETHNTWDIVFKWLSLIGVVIGAAWTAKTYFESRTKEQNSFVFERQASLYLEAAKAAASVAAADDGPKGIISEETVRTEKERFEQLYLGELVIVEDRRVELAMIAFYNCIPGTGRTCHRPAVNQFNQPVVLPADEKDRQEVGSVKGPRLHNLALELAACTRSALQDDRKITFGAVANATTNCPYD